MPNSRIFVARYVAVFLVLISNASLAGDLNTNIVFGRATDLIEKATDGLTRLNNSKKVKISAKWAEALQDKAVDLCSFVQARLKKAHLEDKDAPLCATE